MESTPSENEVVNRRSDEPEPVEEQRKIAEEGKDSEVVKKPCEEQTEEPHEEHAVEPSPEKTLHKCPKKLTARELDFGHPLEEEESSTDSETSADLCRKAEQKKKVRTLSSIEQAEKERQVEEKRLVEERKRKGKDKAGPPPHHIMWNVEPIEHEILQELSSDEEDEEDLFYVDPVNEYEKYMVKIGEHSKKVMSTFDDEKDREIYAQKSHSTVRNMIYQYVHLYSIQTLGVRKKFVKYLCRIGFGWFLQIGHLMCL